MIKTILLTAALLTSSLATAQNQHFAVRYNGFDVVLDCDANIPVYVHYKATKDTGNEKRASSFFIDKDVPSYCQQSSTDSYKIPYRIHAQLNKKISYDRGHLVPANHMDGNKVSIKQSNFMTNIVPMTRTVNRTGAWRQTEKLTECTRDIKDFDVHAGTIVGDDKRDDYFLESHGAPTPDYLWKVLFDGEDIISWLIPNDHNATKEKLDSYRVSVEHIEEMSGLKIPLPSHLKKFERQSEWAMPNNCDWR
tara:strand:+ start:20014 stop:20763 length:750 start_codon:yes stop_codon:yes gene_type:complete